MTNSLTTSTRKGEEPHSPVSRMTVLVVGATGSIGSLVVEEATRQGCTVRALVRNPGKARELSSEAQVVVGDVTRAETLSDAVDGIDAIVFTLGSDGAGKVGAESVDYGGVRNVLRALGKRTARIALMTAIGVTNRTGAYNRSTEAHDWKRRSERLVRVSGLPYTIVRPGWFDYNRPDQYRLTLLQGDTHQTGDASDGVVARRQIAEVLVHSLISNRATRKTFELVAATGSAPEDFDQLFAPLAADPPDALDGVHDTPNMPLNDEPQRVRDDPQRDARGQIFPRSLRRKGNPMRATVMYRAGDVRIENVPDATIVNPTDAVIRITRACICGSDLWPYNELEPTPAGRPMGHEAIGMVEAVGADVRTVRRGDVVVMPFAYSDGTACSAMRGCKLRASTAVFSGQVR